MAAIIKSGQLHEQATAVRHSEFNFEDLSARADVYLDTVRAQAAEILRRAQSEAEAIRQTAAEEGAQSARQLAQQEARATIEAQWKSLTPALEQAIDSLEHLKHSWSQNWDHGVVRLAVAIAERVIRGQLDRTPEISEVWIRESLEMAAGCNQLLLHLNPDDYERMGSLRETVIKDFGQLAPTSIVSDPTVTRGGCRVSTELGSIDQQLESQLSRIESELTE